MSMEVLLRGLAEKMIEEERAKPKPLPEAVVMELREAPKRYTRANPYKVGDLVTPMSNGTIKNAGEPHLVVEVQAPMADFKANEGSNKYGRAVDIRVLSIIEGHVVAHWVESVQFDPWSGPAPAGDPTSGEGIFGSAPSSIADAAEAAPEPAPAAPDAAAPATQVVQEVATDPQGVTAPTGRTITVPASESSNG